MRNLFIIALMLGGAFMAGWFTINRDGDRTSIEINRDEIRHDTRHAIDRGRQLLDREGQQSLSEDEHQAAQSLQQPVQQVQGISEQPYTASAYPNNPYQGQPYGNAQPTDQPQQAAAPAGYNAPQTQQTPQQNVRY